MSEGIGSNLGCEPLEERVQELEQMSLEPHEELELAYCDFGIKYKGLSAEEMPDEIESGGPYSDYRAIEDLYAKCGSLDATNRMKMEIFREVMQRYAESHRNEDTRENEGSSFLKELDSFRAVYGHFLLDQLPDKEAAKYQTWKSIVLKDHKNLDPRISSTLTYLMVSLGDPEVTHEPCANLLRKYSPSIPNFAEVKHDN